MIRSNQYIQLQLETELSKLTVNVTSEHVKGHQSEMEMATCQTKLNRRTDSIFTKARDEHNHRKRRTKMILFPVRKINMVCLGKHITKNIPGTIHHYQATEYLREYLHNRLNLARETCKDLNILSLGIIKAVYEDKQAEGNATKRYSFNAHYFRALFKSQENIG